MWTKAATLKIIDLEKKMERLSSALVGQLEDARLRFQPVCNGDGACGGTCPVCTGKVSAVRQLERNFDAQTVMWENALKQRDAYAEECTRLRDYVREMAERISWLEQQREVECQQKEAALQESASCLQMLDEQKAGYRQTTEEFYAARQELTLLRAQIAQRDRALDALGGAYEK